MPPPEKADIIPTVAEHNVRIANVESLTRDTNEKLDRLIRDFQELQLTLARTTNCSNPALCSTLEPRVVELEKTAAELIATKNKIIGALAVGGTLGTVLGVVGTWLVEFFRK